MTQLLWLLIIGVAYAAVWAFYRRRRRIEHELYARQHEAERRLRAQYDAANANQGSIAAPELLRRADWDAVYGPLMFPLEIKAREESRWPVGAAVQGLASMVTAIFIATLIWEARPGKSQTALGPVTTPATE